ncbi:MAG: hypothetical protein AB7G28_23910 [Pirellulales bacterium]
MERFARRPMLVTLRVVILLGLAGCSSQQRTSANPFMSPDRVPPPATRTIAPGTAAPYYPGDPVPAAQAAAPAGAMVAQAPQVPPPPQVPATAVATPPASVRATNAPASTTSAPQPLAFSNERTVTIPTDNQDLRFAVPLPPATQPPAAAPMAAQTAAAAPAQQVIPASYTQQAPIQPTAAQQVATQPSAAAAPLPVSSAAENSNGPWRSPQIPGTSSGVMQAQYIQQPQAQPTVLAAQPMQTQPVPAAPQMPVQLRAVPSPTTGPTIAGQTVVNQTVAPSQSTLTAPQMQPQLQPQPSPPPRMRFPSWSDPTTWFAPQPEPTANQQLVGYMVPGPNGTQQMISVEQYQAMATGATQPAAVATSDGFRARGTATK